MKKSFTVIYGLVFTLSLLFSSSVFAASKPTTSPTGITVSPAYENVNILAGENQVPVYFSLTNNEPSPQTITLKTADFSSLNYTGGLLFVGSNATQLQKEYGLARWLSLPLNSITLAPNQTTQVSVTINNSSSLAPGGHYGGLLFSVGSPIATSTKNNVSIQPVASALMFVTKLTGATYKLGLSKVTTNDSFFSLPSEATLLFYNNGNSQVTPRGYVTVTNGEGKLVSKGIINTNSDLILPGNSRYFQVPLQKLTNAYGIGNYKLSVNFTFDGLLRYRQYNANLFLGAPILIVALVVSLIILGIVVYLIVKKWDKILRIISRYSPNKPKPKPYTTPKINKPLRPILPPDISVTQTAKPPKKIEISDKKSPKKLQIKDESEAPVKKIITKKTKPAKKEVKVKIDQD